MFPALILTGRSDVKEEEGNDEPQGKEPARSLVLMPSVSGRKPALRSSSSAIWTEFKAAPLSRLSETIQRQSSRESSPARSRPRRPARARRPSARWDSFPPA